MMNRNIILLIFGLVSISLVVFGIISTAEPRVAEPEEKIVYVPVTKQLSEDEINRITTILMRNIFDRYRAH